MLLPELLYSEILPTCGFHLLVKGRRLNLPIRYIEWAHHSFYIQVMKFTKKGTYRLFIPICVKEHKANVPSCAVCRHVEVIELIDTAQKHRLRRPNGLFDQVH